MSEPARSPGGTIVRWSVPCLFALCVACVTLDQWENYRRNRLAHDVAKILRETDTDDLKTLLAALGPHAGGVGVYGGERPWASIKLLPEVWLRVVADLETEAGPIKEVYLEAYSSERVNLEAPDQIVRGPDGTFFCVTAVSATFLSWYWLRVTRRPTRSVLVFLCLLVGVVVPLVFFLALAALMLMRVSM